MSVADEETILSHLEAFCNRLRQILDVIGTMAQFNGSVHRCAFIERQGSTLTFKICATSRQPRRKKVVAVLVAQKLGECEV